MPGGDELEFASPQSSWGTDLNNYLPDNSGITYYNITALPTNGPTSPASAGVLIVIRGNANHGTIQQYTTNVGAVYIRVFAISAWNSWQEIGASLTAGSGITISSDTISVTNPFTDADETKLDGIETGATADQTGAEMVTALSALSGDARLPASAVRDIPSGSGSLLEFASAESSWTGLNTYRPANSATNGTRKYNIRNVANAPSVFGSTYDAILVVEGNGNNVKQWVYREAVAELFTRFWNGVVWTAWAQVAGSGGADIIFPLWATGTAYVQRQTVVHNNELFMCTTNHTSSGSAPGTQFRQMTNSENGVANPPFPAS